MLVFTGYFTVLNVHGHLLRVQRVHQGHFHRLKTLFFLLELSAYSVRTAAQRPGCIAHPTGMEAHVDEELLHLGHTASVGGVEEKTLRGTSLVLAQVALGSAGGFAAFDDLIALAVRTSHGDACRHGPLLREGSCQDEAQCDINFSPSPRLEHYLPL